MSASESCKHCRAQAELRDAWDTFERELAKARGFFDEKEKKVASLGDHFGYGLMLLGARFVSATADERAMACTCPDRDED